METVFYFKGIFFESQTRVNVHIVSFPNSYYVYEDQNPKIKAVLSRVSDRAYANNLKLSFSSQFRPPPNVTGYYSVDF
jgi:hypothetical protein